MAGGAELAGGRGAREAHAGGAGGGAERETGPEKKEPPGR